MLHCTGKLPSEADTLSVDQTMRHKFGRRNPSELALKFEDSVEDCKLVFDVKRESVNPSGAGRVRPDAEDYPQTLKP